VSFLSVVSSSKQSWEGILPPETNEAYHERKGYLTSSQLKEAIPNVYNFKAMVLDPKEPRKKASKSQDLGSCTHEVLLTDDYSQFAAKPEFSQILEQAKDKNGDLKFDEAGEPVMKVIKTIKAQDEEFLAANQGKRIISAEQFDRMIQMVNYIRSKPYIHRHFKHPDVLFEQSYLYQDPLTGMPCQFRPDAIIPSLGLIIDYKTTEDASPFAFKRSVMSYYYHLSAAHYIIGAERVYERAFPNFVFIAQETKYPYKVASYLLTTGTRLKSIAMRTDLLRMIQKAREEQFYPDYIDCGEMLLELPGYAFELGEQRT
jgi:hypothetical protein